MCIQCEKVCIIALIMRIVRSVFFIFILFVFFGFPTTKADELKRIDSINQVLIMQKGSDRVKSLIALSEAYRIISFDKSIKTGLDAVDYASVNNFDELKAEVYKSLGTSAMESGDYLLALDYYAKSLEAFEKAGNFNEMALLNNSIGHQYFLLSDYDSAISYLEKALMLGEKINSDSIAMIVSNTIGNIFYETGAYNKALDAYYKTKIFATELKEEAVYAKVIMNIGLIYWQWDENDRALSELKSAIEIFERLEMKEMLSQALNNVGLIFLYDKEELDTASMYFRQSLEIREIYGSPVPIANVLINMALVYARQDSVDKAEQYFQRTLQIYETAGLVQGILRVYYHLGEFHHRLENYKLSNAYLEKCMAKALEHRIEQYNTIVSDLFMKNYEALGDFQSFLKYYRVFKVNHDTLVNQFNLAQARESQLKYRNIELFQQVEQLSVQTTDQQKKLNLYHYAFIALLGLLFTAMFVYLIIRQIKSLKMSGVQDSSELVLSHEDSGNTKQ